MIRIVCTSLVSLIYEKNKFAEKISRDKSNSSVASNIPPIGVDGITLENSPCHFRATEFYVCSFR